MKDSLKPARYKSRVIDSQLDNYLSIAPAVIIEGPRSCGKTASAAMHSASAIKLDTPEALNQVELDPSLVFEGETPRLLDEWQLAPDVWNALRRRVDSNFVPGSFILTGSSVPADDITRHTGAGRFIRLRMRTMSSAEKHETLGEAGVSFRRLWEAEKPSPIAQMPTYQEVLHSLFTSGFPALTEHTPEQASIMMRGYLDEISRTDVRRLENIRHEPETIHRLLRSLGRGSATEISFTTLAKDAGITPESASQLVALLQRLFVVETVPAWSVALRSKATLRKSPKYHLADPLLAMVAMQVTTPQKIAPDTETVGFIFESAVIHDLLVFTEALGGKVYHYRDSYGNEIDAILTLPDGRWAAVEVKLSGRRASEAAENLDSILRNIDGEPPTFRAVITGTGPVATTKNGVLTFPLAQLRP